MNHTELMNELEEMLGKLSPELRNLLYRGSPAALDELCKAIKDYGYWGWLNETSEEFEA